MRSRASTSWATEPRRGVLPLRTTVKIVAVLIGAWIVYLVAPGATRFVREPGGPFFGVLILVAMAGFLVYAFRELLAGPIHRRVRRIADALELRWQRAGAARELRRRALSVDEEQRVRMLALSARVYEQAAKAITDGKLRRELEDLKARSERVVMRARAHEIERFILRYQIAFTQLSSAPNLSAGEKVRLIREMRELMQAELDGEDAAEASNEESWEYRTPGTDPVTVTASGLRRLVRRGYLGGEDECRRVGTEEWRGVDGGYEYGT